MQLLVAKVRILFERGDVSCGSVERRQPLVC